MTAMRTVNISDAKVMFGPKRLEVIGAASDEFVVDFEGHTPGRDLPYTEMEVACVCTDGVPIVGEQDGKTFHGMALMFNERLVAVFGSTVVVQRFTPDGAAKARAMMKSAVIA